MLEDRRLGFGDFFGDAGFRQRAGGFGLIMADFIVFNFGGGGFSAQKGDFAHGAAIMGRCPMLESGHRPAAYLGEALRGDAAAGCCTLARGARGCLSFDAGIACWQVRRPRCKVSNKDGKCNIWGYK